MSKLLIIDGHNLLFQMFFGMPSRIFNKEGKAIHGTLGFVGALLKIINMTEPTHVVVLFDHEQENARAKLNAEYKANRIDYSLVAEEENPFSQIADIFAALDFMNIRYSEVAEHETDDVIASYAIKYGTEMQVVISSFDSDFFQLINYNVTVLRYRGDKTVICDRDYIQERLGISPEQYADFKSLTGDHADNIKGADKVGPKTASQLINQFGTLKDILENTGLITKPSVCKSIIESSERLHVNYCLIKLDDRAPLPFLIDELLYIHDGITTGKVLAGIGLK